MGQSTYDSEDFSQVYTCMCWVMWMNSLYVNGKLLKVKDLRENEIGSF